MQHSRIALTLLIGGALLFAVGCVTNNMMLAEPLGNGEHQVFDSDFTSTLIAAKLAASEAGLQLEKTELRDTTLCVLLYKKGTSAWSWGEKVRIVVSSDNADSTSVAIVSRRKMATNIAAKGDYSEQLFAGITLNLDLARSRNREGP